MVGNEAIEGARLTVGLLGAPQILWYGEPLAVSRRQARALLYYLAHASEPVARDRLAFLFWPDLPDPTARSNLKRLLSTLRRSLPDGALLAHGRDAVAVDGALVWCDATAFEQLAASSDPAQLAQAVALYRGPFLDGFALPDCPEYGQWQLQVQAQVERAYLTALSSLIDTHAAAGERDAAIDHARRYLAVDELAEDVHRRLINLYAANGDRSAAARQFEQCTLILERELGVKPLPETRTAYEAAIAAQPAPEPMVPTWATLPSLDLPLIGREDDLQALAEAHRSLQSGGLILISGEPGIGKSRLLQEFAATSGSTVLTGNNPAGAQAIPYTAIGEALRQALSMPERWRSIRPIWLAEVGRLLPEIGDVFPDLPRPVVVEPAQAQARLFEALTRCLAGLATQGPLLLCLDDLHWADPATLGWLASLPQRLAGSGVCLMATYRIAHAEGLADLKQTFGRRGLLAEVPLSRLTAPAVGRILEALPQGPPSPRRLAARIHHATGGNAFFVLETVRELLEGDRLADPPDRLPLSPTVQAAIQRRLGNLSPLARQILETAAVLAPDVELDLILHTTGRSDMEVAQGLDELAGRQLLVDGGAHRFSHDLVRLVAYDEISPWRRRILHRRAAQALEATRPPHAESAWAVMAGHYDRAGDAAVAIRYYGQAALAAQQLYAHQEAIGHLERALELLREGLSQPGEEARLRELLGDSLMAGGKHEAAERAYATGLKHLPAEDRLACSILELKVAASFRARLLLPEAEAASMRAIETLGSRSPDWPVEWQHAWLDSQLSLMNILYFQGNSDRLARLIAAIEPVVAAAGTDAHRAEFATGLTELAVRREHFTLSRATVDLFRAGLAVAQETDNPGQIAWAQFGVGFGLLWSGNLRQAEPALLAALDQAEDAGVTYGRVIFMVYLTCLYRFRGDMAAARHYGDRSLAAAAEVDMPIYEGVAHANLAWLRWRDGLTDGARAEAKHALALWGEFAYPFRWLANWVLLAVHEKRGELASAVEQAQAILHPSQRRQPGELPSVLEGAVRAWEAGEPDHARAALQQAIKLARAEGYV